MISYLYGKVLMRGDRFLIITVGGVGYKVYISPHTRKELSDNEEVRIFTHLAVKEDALDLYGFLSYAELELFEMLIGVSGVGPRTALGILSLASPETLRTAIASGDTSYLTKVSGIGKKNADKIILELREKLGAIESTEGGAALAEETDAVEALTALGYSAAHAREALKQVPAEISGTSARVKEALKLLGGGNN